MGACCCCLAKAGLATCKDIADSFSATLVLGVAALARGISASVIAEIVVLHLYVLQAFVRAGLEAVIT